MPAESPKKIVLTPIRNEAWILDRFLKVTSQFADHIIVADQDSTDGSREICKRHEKVQLLDNDSAEYDEASRQRLLIGAARQRVPGQRLLLALDADEILAADAMDSADWRRMIEAKPGTVFHIEEPTFYGTFSRCIRYPGGFPIGYMDDGAEHQARSIHSVRVPTRADSPVMHLENVKVLHYALMRPRAQAAKRRMYSVLENVMGTRHLFGRRERYASGRDYSREGPITASQESWFRGWEEQGIDMRTIEDPQYHWQDEEVLRHFAQYGTRRFWLDDVWDHDWNGCLADALSRGIKGMPVEPIQPPPAGLRPMLGMADWSYRKMRNLRHRASS